MTAIKELELISRPNGGAIDLSDLKRKSWPSVVAQFVRISAPSAYDFRLASNANYVALHDIYRIDGMTSVSGRPRTYHKDLRNKISFVPAGCPVEGWSQIAKPATLVALYLDRPQPGDGLPDLSVLAPQLCFEDPMLRMLLARFQLILHDAALDIPGYAEELSAVATFEMHRIASRQPIAIKHQGGLTPRQTRLLVDYIESHLTDLTGVSELAALLDLTRFHFIRVFKQTLGVPPHRFVIQRRVERAKDLLANSDASIAEVAVQSGFNSVTQLNRAFRRLNGTTPSAFRRDAS